jgi:hypothetical protein
MYMNERLSFVEFMEIPAVSILDHIISISNPSFGCVFMSGLFENNKFLCEQLGHYV